MEDKNVPPPGSQARAGAAGWPFLGDDGSEITSLDELCGGGDKEEASILSEFGWSIPMDSGGFPGFGLDYAPGPSAPPEAQWDPPAADLPARSGDAVSSSSSEEPPPEPDEKPTETA